MVWILKTCLQKDILNEILLKKKSKVEEVPGKTTERSVSMTTERFLW